MNDATKEQLNQFVQKILEYAQKGIDFSVEQVPLLVQEWLRWQLAEATVILVGLVIVFGVLAYLTKKFWSEYYMPLPIFTGTGLIVVSLSILGKVLIIVKVLVAPRVVIVEQFAQWLK